MEQNTEEKSICVLAEERESGLIKFCEFCEKAFPQMKQFLLDEYIVLMAYMPEYQKEYQEYKHLASEHMKKHLP